MTFDQVLCRLSQLALDLDRFVDELDALCISEGEAEMLVGLPISHLTLAADRLGEVIHEAQRLDQRPRRKRKAAAA